MTPCLSFSIPSANHLLVEYVVMYLLVVGFPSLKIRALCEELAGLVHFCLQNSSWQHTKNSISI